jgi:hypothetical protein
MNIYLYAGLEEVEVDNRESLLNALRSLSEYDNDFNGENGIDYLWEEANGFESNMEYLVNEVKDIEDDEECVNTFFEEWLNHDKYYDEWNISVIADEKKRVKAISLAALEVVKERMY